MGHFKQLITMLFSLVCFFINGNLKSHVALKQDSKKLGRFLGKWNGETKSNLNNLQPAGELKDLISPNQGHLRANGL